MRICPRKSILSEAFLKLTAHARHNPSVPHDSPKPFISLATSTIGRFGREEFQWEGDNAGVPAALGTEPAIAGTAVVSRTTPARHAAHTSVLAMNEARASGG
jgi:hypothetical protein